MNQNKIYVVEYDISHPNGCWHLNTLDEAEASNLRRIARGCTHANWVVVGHSDSREGASAIIRRMQKEIDRSNPGGPKSRHWPDEDLI